MDGNLIECETCGNPVPHTSRICPSCSACISHVSLFEHSGGQSTLARAGSMALAWFSFLALVTAGIGITGLIALRLAS